MHRLSLRMRLSKLAAVQKSNAAQALDVSVHLMTNVVELCHDGGKKSITKRSTEKNGSEPHKAMYSAARG